MRTLYYLMDRLDTASAVATTLKELGIRDDGYYIVSKDHDGLRRHNLHDASVLDETDLVHSGVRGAIIGGLCGLLFALWVAITQRQGLQLNLLGAVGLFDWLDLQLQVPLTVFQRGDKLQDIGLTQPQSFGVGSPVIGLRAGILRQKNAPLDLAIQLAVTLPLGTPGALTGGRFSVLPSIHAGKSFGNLVHLALSFGAKVVCVPHNLLQPDLVPALLEDVEGFGAGLLVRSPLLHGLLTDGGVIREAYPDDDHRSRRWAPPALAVRRKQAAGFGAAWVQQTKTLTDFAIRWALTSPVVASAIIGPRTKDQLRQLVDAVTPVDHLEPGLYERTTTIAAALGV